MAQKIKRAKKIDELIEDPNMFFSIEKAIEILKKCPEVRFDQSVEFALKLGIDPKKSDQQVRGTVTLPHGTGKKVCVVVIAKGEKIEEAKEAKADFVGSEELIEKIKNGWTDFDVLIVTPDMMREVSKLGKVLGPRGLMPTPKAGTVTNDIKKAVEEMKAGKIEFKVDKNGVIHAVIGKLSFSNEKIEENIRSLLQAIARAKPSSAKGIYMKSLCISSSMGPGLKVDLHGYV